MKFEWDARELPDPSMIWASYDRESDSFILYTTGKPKAGVHVWVGADMYVIVDRNTQKAIGLYVEHWERSFVPSHKEIRELWEGLRLDSLTTEKAWTALMRMVALWVILSLGVGAEDYPANLQPA
jgi:hypothetical protein